ncbi:hypothetical protein ADICYQ_3680 [Cyclobacterium qasimii M12-11B]|uniref:Uncharacterized protein n=1 Tax=Cyclobacterium qasimii M12-11B TaxID=641524 RepID=S7WKQ1_9BACT|nr:hypothetical protein ADICYQ_3680 [Cyclobacterium qasimii M12-11B]
MKAIKNHRIDYIRPVILNFSEGLLRVSVPEGGNKGNNWHQAHSYSCENKAVNFGFYCN